MRKKLVVGGLVAIGMSAVCNVVISAAISAVFCLLHWLLSLCGLCESPTWLKFIGGCIGVFALLFTISVVSTVAYVSRCMRDPVFWSVSEATGITWRDYKRWRGADKNIKDKHLK